MKPLRAFATLHPAWRRLCYAVGIVLALAGIGRLVLPAAGSLGVPLAEQPFYSLPFGDKPFAPAEWRTRDGRLVNWRAAPAAERCAECHRREYMEWNTSLHAVSDLDLIYDASVQQNTLSAHAAGSTGTEKGRWCEGCHNPLGTLTGAVTPITAVQETEALEQGVTCVVCHTSSHAEPMVGNAALVSNLNNIVRHLHEGLIMGAPSRHARDMQAKRDHPFMGESGLCGACHTEIRPALVNGEHRLDFQTTFEEWRASPWAAKGVQCQNCHMANDPAAAIAALKRGDKPAGGVSHRLVGGNYLLTDPDTGLLQTLRGGRPSGVYALYQPAEHRKEMLTTLGQTKKLLQSAAELAVTAQPAGNALALAVAVTNSGAGHALPTGPLDQRHMWLEVTVSDANGKTLFHSGAYDEKRGRLTDRDAALWVKRMEDYGKPGEPNLRHVLFDVERLSYPRKPIPAGETQTVDYTVALPRGATGPYRVEAKLWYRLAFQEILKNIEEQDMGDMSAIVIPRLEIAAGSATVDATRTAAAGGKSGGKS